MNEQVETSSGHQKITQAELIGIFGESIPIDAAKLLYEKPDGMTIAELRAKLCEIAARGHQDLNFVAHAIATDASWQSATLTHADVDFDVLRHLIFNALTEAVAAETRRCIEVAFERSAQVPNQNDFYRGYAEGRVGAATDIRKSRPLMTAP